MKTWTVDEILALVKTLTPDRTIVALDVKNYLWATPLIERVAVDGVARDLALTQRDGIGPERYGAGYVRVSTQTQQLEGFSNDDQVRNIIYHYWQRGQAFRVFSDAGLSGSLPWDTPDLITRMVEARARRYKQTFSNVFLSRARRARYAPGVEASVRQYLDRRLKEIRKAAPTEELGLTPKIKQPLVFRPALSALVGDMKNIHTVAVNDLTRLSRNQHLLAEIGFAFQREEVKVVGLAEHMGYLNDDDEDNGNAIGNQVTASVLAALAEQRLREALLGNFRGQLERLEQGLPNGKRPWWIEVAEDGKARVKDGALEAVYKCHEYTVEEGLRADACATRLMAGGTPIFTKAGVWTRDAVKATVTSRALLGYQYEYGLEFKVYPALVTPERWHQLQARWADKKMYDLAWIGAKEGGAAHKGRGLFVCVCRGKYHAGRGGTLSFQPSKDPEKEGYVCGCRRRNRGTTHIRLDARNAHAFIDGLMATDPAAWIQEGDGTADLRTLQRRLETAVRGHADAQGRVSLRREALSSEVSARIMGLGVRPEDEAWGGLYQSLMEHCLSTTPEALEAAEWERERKRAEREIADYVPRESMEGLKRSAQGWHGLSEAEQNVVLHRTFEGWYFRRAGDSDLDLEMVMVLRGGRALPPVRIDTSESKGRRIWRRLPSIGAWITAVAAGRRNRSDGGG